MRSVYVIVTDGLGNQLFQAALGLALTRRFGFKVRYVIRPQADPYGREILLDRFPALSFDRAPWGEIEGLPVVAGYGVNPEDLIGRLGDSPAVVLAGWWQREGFFFGEHQAIRDAFALDPDDRLTAAGDQLRADGVIGVHVRRSEYGHLGLAKASYYRDAIADIRTAKGPRRAVFFTDEPNYCWTMFNDLADTAIARGNLANPLADFYLLSRCSHFVIANSTFSWWAAWLGRGDDTIVHAPSPWFLDAKIDPALPDWRRTPDALVHP